MNHNQLTDFLGEWILLPSQCNYEVGHPPKHGSYRIEWKDDHLVCTMNWIAADDSEHQAAYTTTPDGSPLPYTESDLADMILSRLTDECTLDTAAMKAGVVVNFARRVLSEDGMLMTVTQSGVAPDGKAYANRSVYRKQLTRP